MAEYRGLTVRIGADTSRFTAALRATQSAIKETQNNLRQLKQAMAMDPGSKNAAAMYVGELQSQAVSAISRVRELRNHIKEVGEEVSKSDPSKTLKKMAEETDNAALSAQRAKAAYNDVTDAIAQVYTNLSDLSTETRMQMGREEAAKLGETFSKKFLTEHPEFKGIKFDVDNSSIQNIARELQVIYEKGHIGLEEADETIETIMRLKGVWNEMSDAYDDARTIDQLHNEQVEVEALKAKYKELATQRTDAAKSELSEGLRDDYSVLENLGTEVDKAAKKFEQADEKFRLNPLDQSAAVERMDALTAAIETTEARATKLKDIISQYRADGLQEVVDQTQNITQAMDDAREASIEANEWLEQLKSEYDLAIDAKNKARVDGSEEDYSAWSQQADALKQLIEYAEQYSDEMTTSFTRIQDAVKLDSAITELQGTNNQLDNLRNTAVGSQAVFVALAQSIQKTFDNSLARGLEDDQKKLVNLTTETQQAVSRFEQLDKAMELRPGNFDRIADRTRALNEALHATQSEMEQVKSILDTYSANGIDQIAANTDNLTQSIADAKQKFDDAALSVATFTEGSGDIDELRAKLADAAQELHDLQNAADYKDKSSYYQQLSNSFDELGDKAKQLRQHLNDLATAEVNRIDSGLSHAFDTTLSDMDALGDRADMAKDKFEALNNSFEANPWNIDRLAERTNALRDAVQAAKDKADALDKAIADMKGQGIDKVLSDTKNLVKATSQARDKWVAAQAAVKKYKADLAAAKQASDKIRESNERIPGALEAADAEVDRLTNSLNQAEQAAEGAYEAYSQFGKANVLQTLERDRASVTGMLADFERQGNAAADSISTSMFMAIQEMGQYAWRALDSVADATMAIDTSLTSVRKTVNGTEEQYEALRDAAIASSKVQPISASAILEAEALGGQLGFNIRQVEEFARVATGLEVSTDMGWEEASTNMAQFFNIFQTNKNLVGNYGSAIVDLGNNFATTESAISQMSARIASAGTSIGMSEADVLGLSAALSSMGVKAEAGGSSISTIMTNIDKSVAMGTAGIKQYSDALGMGVEEFVSYVDSLDDDALQEVASQFDMAARDFKETTVDSVKSLEEWSKVAGFDTAADFAKAWSEEPVDALTRIFLGLDKAADEGGNLALMLDNLGISSIRQLDISRRLAANPELLADAVKMANDAWVENIALDTEVARRNESISAKFDMIRNSIDAVKAELGEGLVPIVNMGVGFFKNFSDILDMLPTGLKTFGITVTGAVAGIGLFLPVIHKVKVGIRDFIIDYAKSGGRLLGVAKMLKDSFTAVTAGLGSFAMAAPVATAGIALAVGIFGEFAIKAYAAKKRQDEFNKALGGMGSASKTTADRIAKIADSSDRTVKSIQDLTEEINQHNDAMRNIQSSYENDASMLQMYKDVIMDVGASVRGVAKEDIPEDKLADLKWAIDGVNQQLGTQLQLQDFISGQYKDEQGEIQNTIDYLDQLISKREEEARISVDQTLYEKAIEARMEATKDVADAERAYADQQKLLQDTMAKSGLNDEELAKQSLRLQHLWNDQLQEDLEASRTALAKYEEDEAYYKNKMENDSILSSKHVGFDDFDKALQEAGLSTAAYANLTAQEFRALGDSVNWDLEGMVNKIGELYGLDPVELSFEYDDATLETAIDDIKSYVDNAFQGWDIDWSDALGRNNISLDEFAQKAADAGVSLDDLKAVANDPDVFFSQWVDECEGDIDALIAKIQGYNGTKVENESIEGEAERIRDFVDTAFQGWDIDWSDALERNGSTMDEFAQKAEDAGIKLGDLKSVAEDPGVTFAQWVDECEGDIDALIDKIQEYNDTHLEDKKAELKVEAANVEANVKNLFGGQTATVETVQKTTAVLDTSNAEASAKELKGVYEEVPVKIDTAFNANTDSASDKASMLKQLIDSLPTWRNIFVSMTVDTSSLSYAEQRYEQFKQRTRNAAGGIRYHADGVILNRPTWIGGRDIAGEAGAEAIIPLTNRRYVQPFADTVADGMMSKLNELQAGGDVYNITVNAVGDTGDEIARAITRELRAYQLMTNGR